MEPTATPITDHTREPSHTWPADRVRIVSTPGMCGGKPRIDGHRITVEDVAVWRERMGMSLGEIVAAYPRLTLSDVHAALAYYEEHRALIDTNIQEGGRFVAEMKAKLGPSLLQEKLRQGQADASNDPVPRSRT